MKLLFDQNISFRLVIAIRDLFPDAKQVKELGLENQSDRKIWEFARDNEYTIVTFDSDFFDYSLVWGYPPKIVWIRTGNKTTKQLETLIRESTLTIIHFLEDDEVTCLQIIEKNVR